MRKNENYFQKPPKNSEKIGIFHKIFKIFRRAFSHKKCVKNLLTTGENCAKIGIVKVFFTNIGNNFHNLRKILHKSAKK